MSGGYVRDELKYFYNGNMEMKKNDSIISRRDFSRNQQLQVRSECLPIYCLPSVTKKEEFD